MGKLLERLRDPARSGVYRVARRNAIDESGLDTATIELKAGDPIGAVARALRFPDWFGGNWDALEDCLGDLEGESHVLLFLHAERLAADERGILLDVLRSSAEYWAGRGKPFFAVFLDPQARLDLPALHREK
jgi:Barstar (barnase inhibitor)